jgi:hypothetical protein
MGGGGKGGGNYVDGLSQSGAQVAYNNAMNALNTGQSYEQIMAGQPGAPTVNKRAYDDWAQQRQQQAMFDSMFGMMEGFMAPMSEEPTGSSTGPTQEEQEQQRLEQERTEGLAKRDTLYGDYLDAANASADYIDQQIAREEANAKLLGIEYQLTPEQRSERVNNYFASIWDESKQSELEGLFEKWGNPEGFEDWRVVRGETPTQADRPEDTIESTTGAPTAPAGGTTSAPLTSVLGNQDDENLLGSSTLLGG